MTAQPAGTYDFPFGEATVYGHALELLVRHRKPAPAEAIHLDIGCGYGRIAEPLVAALGRKYVGCDGDAAGLESLKARGFEVHRLVLAAEEETYAALRDRVGGRPVASISILDTLEHLADSAAAMRAISRLAQENGALVVASVPNVTHRDIAAKLVLGRLDITDVGILDHTHTRIFSTATFDAELRANGLYPFDSFDTEVPEADQHFPPDHCLLTESTVVGGLLRALRSSADAAHAAVLQHVRICSPGPCAAIQPYVKAYVSEQRPFLTAVVRTQGRRIHTLRETLLCLSGQTDLDMEILVLGHKLGPDESRKVEQVVADQPEETRARTRLIHVVDGGRSRPLNVGFTEARGRYIVIVDDDDTPMAHWLETFRALDRKAPGRVLRALSVRQDVRSVSVQGLPGLRAEGSPEHCYARTFDLFRHLRANHSPPICLAFPRSAFHDLGFRFDEALTTTEDWDFAMRVALLLGVESSPECTSVYRWWKVGGSSRSEHDQAEWDRNYDTVVRKMDASYVVLPPGSTRRLREAFFWVSWIYPARDALRRLWLRIPEPWQPAARRMVRKAYRRLKGLPN